MKRSARVNDDAREQAIDEADLAATALAAAERAAGEASVQLEAAQQRYDLAMGRLRNEVLGPPPRA